MTTDSKSVGFLGKAAKEAQEFKVSIEDDVREMFKRGKT